MERGCPGWSWRWPNRSSPRRRPVVGDRGSRSTPCHVSLTSAESPVLRVDPYVCRTAGFPDPPTGWQRRLLRVPAVPYHVSLRPALWSCGLIPASGGRSGSQYRRSSCCLGDDLQSSPPTSRVYIILLPRTTYRHWQDFAALARQDASPEHRFTTTVSKNLSLMEH